ncbi:MAG: leucine-rich repeat domain-containing protein [Tannerellaceae bacterium]|jgi:hypothetical protein|nr:leucine-rich repeat domain-containing protein [Tannerellaceae bacterium]
MEVVRKVRIGLWYIACALVAWTGQAATFDFDVMVAGSLRNILPENTSNLNEVTLRGFLNATDFATLSELANLTRLDISGVYIEEGEIPDNTFAGKTLLVEVLFPEEGLTVIGAGAFAGTGLSGTLVLPQSLTTLRGVDNSATSATKGIFENCSHLSDISFGAKLENIGSRAFSGCTGLTGPLVLPPALKIIEAMAFYHCTGLTGPLVLPAGVHTLGYPTEKSEGGVFEGCTNLKGLLLSEQLQTLGNGAFKDCGKIEGEILLTPKISSIGDATATKGVFENCRRVSRVMFTDNVKEIGRFAFSGCESLSDVGAFQLPANLEYIGEGAFFRCRNLQGLLSIPNKVYAIGTQDYAERGAFEDCSFTGIAFDNNSELRTIGGRTFSSTNLGGTLGLPDKVEYIGEMAFYNCSLTGTLVIPDKVTHIGDLSEAPNGVFENCAFTGLQLGKRVQVIGRKAFAGTKLEGTLQLPTSLQIVGGGAFYGCAGLTGKLTIPSGVHTIEGISKHVEVGAFEGASFEKLELRDGNLSSIGERAFFGNEKLEGNLTLPSSLIRIGDGAFFGCLHLKGLLVIPNKVRAIGNIANYTQDDKKGVFEGCIGFVALKMGTRVDTIGDRAFFGCIRLRDKVYIPRTTEIGRDLGITIIRTDFHSSYVSPDGNDTNDGSSWAKAFKTVGKALSVSQEGDGILYLREGVYEEDMSTPIYDHYLEIIGGFTGTESLGDNPKGGVSVLQNSNGAALRFSDANKAIVFLRKLSIKGIDAHCPLEIYTEDVEVFGRLMLRQETFFTGDVTVGGEIYAQRQLSFQGILTLNEATLNPQESLPFRTDSLILKEPSRINVSSDQETDRFFIMEVTSGISNLSKGFQVFFDERHVDEDLIVWEKDITNSYHLQISPVMISFLPPSSYSGMDFFLIGGQSYPDGRDTSVPCFQTVEFAVQMDNIYRSVKPIVMVDNEQVETFDWDELTGVYHYEIEAINNCQVSVELNDEKNLVMSLEYGDGVIVTGFDFNQAYVSPHNKFYFTVSLDNPSKYALIYVDGAFLSIPKEANGLYKVELQNITSNKIISVQVSNTPPLSITSLSPASIQISAIEGGIHIHAPSPLPFSIYTLTGKEKIRQTISGSHLFPFPQGTYIVKAGFDIQKVFVR